MGSDQIIHAFALKKFDISLIMDCNIFKGDFNNLSSYFINFMIDFFAEKLL